MKRLWDKFTDNLGRTILHPQFFLKNLEYEAVLVAKKNIKKGVLVDIGCGRQPYKKDLLPYTKKYIGIDHPKVSKRYLANEKPDILADATKIPLPDNFANLTMMISVLEHLPNPTAALKEAYRITKKNGSFVTVTIQNYRLHDEPYDYFRYTRFGLKEILEKSRFKKIKITPLGNFPILFSQYFNIFIFYTIKKMLSKNLFYKFIAIISLPFAFILSFVSNILALILTKLFRDRSGDFAIYNLAIAKKI